MTVRPPRYVGARVHRVEDPRVLAGRGCYLDDVRLPGLLHVAFVRSPHAHARILSVDLRAAARARGVIAAIAGDEADRLVKPWRGELALFAGMRGGTQHALAVDKVRFVGEPVAAVVAADRYMAEDAAELVEVEYEALPAVVEPEAALAPDTPRIHDDLDSNVMFHTEHRAGDTAGAFAAADRVFTRRHRVDRHTATTIEPRGIIASYEPFGGTLTVWSSTQVPHMMQAVIADRLGLDEQRVRVIAPDVGGGFGLKIHLFQDEITACALAVKLGRPVKFVADRRESFLADTHARDETVELTAAVRADGTVLGLRAKVLSGAGAYSVFPRSSVFEGNQVCRVMPGPYRIFSYDFDFTVAFLNKSPLAHYRAVGHPVAIAVMEDMMDTIAVELGLDPAEVRFRNFVRPEEFPWKSPSGYTYDSGSYTEALRKLLDEAGYEELRARQAAARLEGKLLGLGLSCFIEGTGFGPQIYGVGGAPIASTDTTTVRIEPNGKVTALVGTGTQGQGLRTTYAQVIADELGVELGDVQVVDGDTAAVPYGGGSYGSRSAVIAASAALLAAGAVREKVVQLAAHVLEASPDDIELANRQAFVNGSPERGVSLADLGKIAYYRTNQMPPGVEPGLLATRTFTAPLLTFTNGAHLAVVEVDPETAEYRLLSYTTVEDCGRLINPAIVEQQIRGGVAQGIGGALYEHLIYDEGGQLLTTTLLDYVVPTAREIPPIEVHHLETPARGIPSGCKGAGEAGTAGAPAAVVNAINDALRPLGLRVADQPVSPNALYRLLRDRS